MNGLNDKVRKIFDTTRRRSRDWSNWYFGSVLDPADARILTVDGNAVSTLTQAHYGFQYAGQGLSLSLLCNAATIPQARGKGYMTQMVTEALRDAYAAGDAFAAVIPHCDRLYFFYDKFGFSTVIYNDVQRYTSAHRFEPAEHYMSASPDYELFNALERRRQSTVLHSEAQFDEVRTELAMRHGRVDACVDNSGQPAAIAFSAPSADGAELVVEELLAVSEDAADSVLSRAKSAYPDKPVVVNAFPGDRGVSLRAHGVMRVVNVKKVLSALAASAPNTEQVIRIHDFLIPQNNGVFVLHDGTCTRMDHTLRRLTLDVNVRILTSILFSSEDVGRIFGLPACRVSAAMMLD